MDEKKVNKLLLERYVLDELPDARKKEVEKRLESSPALRAELEHIKNSEIEILEQYPADKMVPGLVARQRAESYNRKQYKQKTKLKRFLFLSPVLAAALAMIFILLPFEGEKINTNSVDITRIKGGPGDTALLIYRKTSLNAERLNNGDRAEAGDLLQVAYRPGKAKHGIIISIDGSGVVTLHFPYNRSSRTVLEKKKIEVFLRNAYELDNAPGFERFFFITSREEPDVSAVLTKAKKLARQPVQARTETLELDGSHNQTTILIEKGGKK